MAHTPVLLNEVIAYLNPQKNQNFIDCTVGGGGHALKILSLTKPNGKLLGLDLSQEAILKLQQIEEQRLILVCDNFVHLKTIVEQYNFGPINGILMDLGLSSDLLETSKRGFSFAKDEPLDMRFSPTTQDFTAQMIIRQYSKDKLTEIFRKFGEEKFARQIAEAIVNIRKKENITSTLQLAGLIETTLGRRFHIKSLARVFQALRIEVNNELEILEQTLNQGMEILNPGGRLVVISFHSLEDRIVKLFFKKFKKEGIAEIITKKPLIPTDEEIRINSRSRSAKLRVAEKI
ncbi:MAG: 16S rRNA (cytosine(1402)-N(4))-methyltransferase RsmH [Patescibacteria group bacterium]